MTSYELKQKSRIEEIGVDTVLLEHRKTGARVFLMPCDDENKVFAIGFRTPVENSTGVAHILEHSVLCGSEKYPCKDPFIELAKGSLNTFLNAMTYPDKTVYPVASCNDRDFENLMDVYLDAVFNPNIHREEKIFKQEGWHYELDSPDGELTYNGVVYNEMKGVYSSADGLLERAVDRILYGGHTYGEESGGDPDNIPELTYEQFKDFHKRYYHPGNSYIILYGNCDMERLLEKIDAGYLSKYEKSEINSEIPLPEPLSEPADVSFKYPISDSEDENNTAILTVNMAVDCELDAVEYTAMQILDYVLLDAPGAPLREALIDAGIGDDISGGFSGGIRLPYFAVVARNAQAGQKNEFLRVVEETLKKQSEGELDKLALKAAINVLEFRSREADFGSMPKGLIYALQSFDSWLYDADPTIHLRFADIFEELKKRLDTDYFETLIKERLIENRYRAVVTLVPEKGLTQKNEQKLKERLADVKARLSSEEVKAIIESTKALKDYQSEPSKKEDIEKIPVLKRGDITRVQASVLWEEREAKGCRILFSNVFTSGISYIKLMFDMDKLDAEEIAFCSLLTEVFGYIDTQKHTYAELSTLINLNSGGVGFSVESYPNVKNPDRPRMMMTANAKVLYGKTDFAFEMFNEILFGSRLGDIKRLKEILAEVKSRTKDGMLSSGHLTALNRAGAAGDVNRWFLDETKGIGYYRMLENADAEKLPEIFERICGRLFSKDNLLIDIVCDEEGFRKTVSSIKLDCRTDGEKGRFEFTPQKAGKEAFTSASMVNYVARFGNFGTHGYKYTGALAVLRVLMNYNYLWNNIRVLGGAYGCSAVFGSSGTAGFTTFRDPNLKASDEIFLKIPGFLRNYEADEREMTKSVIGAISERDIPLTPLGEGLKALSAYLGNESGEDRQKARDEIIDVTVEDIRALAPLIEAALSDSCVCALANESKANGEAEYFDTIEPLYRKEDVR